MLLPFSYLRRRGRMEKKTTFYVEGGKIRDLLESTIPVKRIGNTYTFTEDVNGKITIRESDVVIDGNGYSLLGKGDQKAGDAGFGLCLREVRNVTIRNLKIKHFDFGVFISNSSNIIVSDNEIGGNNYCGIYLWKSNNNRIFKNNIAYTGDGVDLYYSSDNVVSENSVVKNDHGLYFFRSLNNTVSRNRIMDNRYSGVCFRQSSKNVIEENDVSNNDVLMDKSSENKIPGNMVRKFLEDEIPVSKAKAMEKVEGRVPIGVDNRVKKVFIRIGDIFLEGTDFRNNIDIDEVKDRGKPVGGVRAILLLNPGEERIMALALDIFADPATGEILSACMFKEDFK